MTWDFSTFGRASWQTIIIFYTFSVFMGIAAQLSSYVAHSDMGMYLLIVCGVASLTVYAHGFMGWTIPRPIYLLGAGGASLWALSEFDGNANRFALVCLAGFIVCAALATALTVANRRLKAFHANSNQHGKE